MIQWWLFSISFWGIMSFFSGLLDMSSTPFGPTPTPTPLSCDQRIANGEALSIVMQADVMSIEQINVFSVSVDIPYPNTCFVKAFTHIGTGNYFIFPSNQSNLNIIRILTIAGFLAVTTLTFIVFVVPVIVQTVYTVRSIFRL